MITLPRWTELLASDAACRPADKEEYERLKDFDPVVKVAAVVVRNALGPDRMRPWWAR